jgi:hypothetical protein
VTFSGGYSLVPAADGNKNLRRKRSTIPVGTDAHISRSSIPKRELRSGDVKARCRLDLSEDIGETKFASDKASRSRGAFTAGQLEVAAACVLRQLTPNSECFAPSAVHRAKLFVPHAILYLPALSTPRQGETQESLLHFSKPVVPPGEAASEASLSLIDDAPSRARSKLSICGPPGYGRFCDGRDTLVHRAHFEQGAPTHTSRNTRTHVTSADFTETFETRGSEVQK